MCEIGISPAEAAIVTDACVVPYNVIHHTGKVQPGETVLIIGCGGLGLNMIQMLLGIGATVYVHDKRQVSLDQAIEFGVPKENAIPPDADLTAFVAEKGFAIDVVIDLVGIRDTLTQSQMIGKFSPNE